MKGKRWRQKKAATACLKLAFSACLLQPLSAHAACKISSVDDVAFGAYDVFSAAPNTDGVGSLDIKCTGGSSATVKLSRGLSNSFAPRTLRYGSQVLNYNLYTSAARNIVWGDGSGGTSVMPAGKKHSDHLSIFGSIPQGQDASVGSYNDHITITVSF